MARFETKKHRPWPVWISALLGVVAAISLFIQLANPVGSPDLWWHMLYGRHILETGSLIVDHSIFTWTPADPSFPYTGWLGEIVLYLVYKFTGTAGLLTLRYGVFFLIILLGWHYAFTRRIASNPLVWTIIILGLALTWQAPLIKTELFTVCFFTITVWLYFHMRYRGDHAWWLPYLLPLILVIWVNTHGAFAIASIFFLAIGIGEILNSRFCPSQAMAPRLKRHFFIALALCLPAIFISPFGYELPYSIISSILTYKGSFGRVTGFKPTYLFNIAPYYLLDYMVVAMLLFVFLLWQKLRDRQTDWVVILAFLGYSALFPKLARASFFLGPVFLFVCLDLLAKHTNSWAWPSSTQKKSILALLCISISALIGWRVIDNNICRLFGNKYGLQQAFSISASFPIAETEYIKNHLSGKKIGNMYRDGGYLLYHLWPEKKVMIDTRYFPFSKWVDDYVSFIDGENMEKFIHDHPADYWLVNYKFANNFRMLYRSDAWKLAFLGPAGAIFVPTASAPEKPESVPDIGPRINLGNYSYIFRAAIQLDDLTFAKRLLRAAQQSNGPSCGRHNNLTREMENAIAGLDAYHNGDYQKAFQLLKKNGKYISTRNKAADALVKLAEQSRDQGDITGARNWYLKVFEILPRVAVTDLYNFSVLDWEYRTADNVDLSKPMDEFNWKRFAGYILSQKEQMLPAHRFIIETAQAMKDGHYDGTARLIPRTTGYPQGQDEIK